jgi:tetratricopeptide (TPR) repeat protein
VLSNIGRTRLLGGNHLEGLRLARDALSLAEALDLVEIRAHALATIGLGKTYLGDPTGKDDELHALELATAANSPVAGSIANNVAVSAFFDFDIRRADELLGQALQIAERFGDAASVRWLTGHLGSFALMLGHWNEALEMIDEFIAECESGSPHYLETRAHIDRGRIRQGRGDADGALAEFERALALVRPMSDPQAVMPVLGAAYTGFETYGRLDEARSLLVELVGLAEEHPLEGSIGVAFEPISPHHASEFGPRLRAAVERSPLPRWREVALICLDRDFAAAADRWADAGGRTMEARLRLRAAEELGGSPEAEEQARKALDFYVAVDATYYVERCEGALAAGAQSESA